MEKLSFRTIRGISLVFLLCFIIKAHAEDPRIYIATNKETYAPSENILFKVILLNTAGNTGHTLYAELLDCMGNRVTKKMLPLFFDGASGTIDIPQDPAAGFYLLYCYVWVNGHAENKSTKKIFITGSNKRKGNWAGQKISVAYFFESNSFVAEIPNNILLKCTDENGNPMTASGRIVNGKRQIFAGFETDEQGYAKVVFNPEANTQYFIGATGTNGKQVTVALPIAQPRGLVLNITTSDTSINYTAISYLPGDEGLEYSIETIAKSEKVYTAGISFQKGFSAVKEVIKSRDLPGGYLTFRLVDQHNTVYAQRIIYNTPVKTQSCFLRIIDTVSNSFAVTELPGFISGTGYIRLLTKKQPDSTEQTEPVSDLKKYCELPLLETPGNAKVSLNDLLIAVDNIPEINTGINEKDPGFLTLNGTVYSMENKPIKNRKVNLFFIRKNLKKDFMVTSTDRNGNFEIKGLLLYDSVTVYYQLADKSEEKNSIHIDFKVTPDMYTGSNELPDAAFNCLEKNGTDSAVARDNKNRNALINKNEKTLKEVTVTGQKQKQQTATEKFIEQNVSGQHNQTNSLRNEYDFIANPPVISNTSLLEFLRGRMSGLIISVDARGSLKITTTYGSGIGVYLNDMELDADDLSEISYLQVNEVALVRYYSMPLKPRSSTTKSRFGGGAGEGGDLMIYTKKNYTPSDPTVKGLAKATVLGYPVEKAVPIQRVTGNDPQCVYWNPDWSPQSKEAIINIGLPQKNNSAMITLTIEGINTNNVPYSFTKNLFLTSR